MSDGDPFVLCSDGVWRLASVARGRDPLPLGDGPERTGAATYSTICPRCGGLLYSAIPSRGHRRQTWRQHAKKHSTDETERSSLADAMTRVEHPP